MSSNYVCLDGKYLPATEPVLMADNRSFSYGDALFETIRAYGTEAFFLEDHLERLLIGMKELKMDIPGHYSTNFFQKNISRTLTKNKIFKAARVRLTVFRNSLGFYTPTNNEVSFLISVSSLKEDLFELNKKGYKIGLYDEIRKPQNILSNLKSANALLFVMAGIYKQDNNLDECLILNETGSIIESISSNIFILEGKNLYTPSVSEGCITGTMRKKIIELSGSLGLKAEKIKKLTVDNLLIADEVLLTNAIQGIRWVMGYGQRRFYHKYAQLLTDALNRQIKP